MFKKKPLKSAIGLITALSAGGLASLSGAEPVKVDINANVKHSVNGANQFERERRITIHASPIENEFLGEKEKLDYLMELGAHFGRDAGTSMYYFKQTEGDPTQPPPQDELFPWGFLDEFSRDSLKDQIDGYHLNLQTKYIDSQEYFDRTKYMIGATQPHPAFPNWSTYSWFGGGLESDNPWRPRTNEQTGDWVAAFLEEAYLRDTGDDAKMPMPHYWEVVNEPDMQMNTTGPEGHVNTWEALFDYHNAMADAVRAKLGDKAPKVGGMTWGLHDFHLGDATAFGAPRLKGEALLTAFYGADTPENKALKDRIRDEIFAASPTMNDTDTGREWYQWDVIWKQFLDVAGENMDFYSIHLYDWPLWSTAGGRVRTGSHSEAVMDLLEWYDDKMVPGPKKEVIVSEFGSVTGDYQKMGTVIDRSRMRWEKLKPFSQMQMQFLERPDYITMSLPFIVVKGAWGDLGKEQPYSQSLLDRDYSTCDSTADAYTNCTWNFNASIHWYELWRDIDGTRLDTFSSDRDIQVDAYVNNNDKNGENHLYVIINSMETVDTEVDLSWAGISGNSIESISMRHLYLDEAIDTDNNTSNGTGKPIMAEAELASLPEFLVVGADSTIVLDIEYASAINPAFNNNEAKFSAEPLAAAAPHRVAAGGSNVSAQVNGVSKPAKGEAQLRVTGAFFLSHFGADGVNRSSLTINGNEVTLDNDLRGEGQEGLILATLEFPFPVEYLAADGNNSVEFSFLPAGQLASMAIQVWDFDTDITRSTPGSCDGCSALTGFAIAETSLALKVTETKALGVQLTPANATDKRVTWTSSDPSVASVDANGLVTGTGMGSATITGRAGGMSETVSVTVSQLVPTSVGIAGVPSKLYVGSTKQLSAAVRPIYAPNRAVTWTSSNPAIASVDADGLVTANAAGSVNISARSVADTSLEASVSIRTEVLAVESLELNPEFTLVPTGGSFTIDATIEPVDASNQGITWQSSDESVATVADGVVTPVSLGRATISARTHDGGFTGQTVVEVVDGSAPQTVIEAEDFDSTGGAAGGFEISVEKGNINNNQTGDWAEYNIDFASRGTYQLQAELGSPSGGGIEVFVEGSSAGRASVPNTGDWDAMQTITVSNGLSIAAPGTYRVRIQSIGAAGAWQWNMDKIAIRKLTDEIFGDNAPTPEPVPSFDPAPSPTPVPSPSALPSMQPSPVPSAMPSQAPEPSPEPSVVPSAQPSIAPSMQPQPSPSPQVSGDPVPAQGLKVELENFVETGTNGGSDNVPGFNKSPVGINTNTSGDWADYRVRFEQTGHYDLVLSAATPMANGANVRILLDGQQIASAPVVSTGDWEAYMEMDIANDVLISAGTYTVRVESHGASQWQWNADFLEFVQMSISPTPSPEPSVVPSPSPSLNPVPSPQPSFDPQPSPQPSVNPQPSFVPQPSPQPSVNPQPSFVPQPSPQPSVNPQPSFVPQPSPQPSVNPQPSSQPQPSTAPSANPQPSFAPSAAPSPQVSPSPSAPIGSGAKGGGAFAVTELAFVAALLSFAGWRRRKSN
ncbi:Ig-like domain-containing protein [Agaribacterium haliotis]|uniref:Ig-like domain-containing protein n=1 Tax=Agaribacterium haliotis TaxID=2013869 RepID=UPI0013045670|nr:Ig-like domain-containing protein [Agaribacterium haliotis]